MSNCLIFALLLYWRREAKGKRVYFARRKSDMVRTPHFVVFELRRGEFRCISYKPTNPKHKACPPPIFHGRVVWGDQPPNTQGGTTRKGS